jgi:hypothetical protein
MHIKGCGLIVARVVAGVVVAAVVLAVPSALLGQTPPTLGEVAKKEAERRKALPPAGKVYTNKDLPPSALKPAGPSTAAGTETTIPLDPVAAATGDQAAGAKPGEVKDEGKGKEEKNEAWWRARITTARDDLRRKEMFAEALQTRINSLGRDFTSRDNPAQRAQIGRDRTEALAELARVKTEIEHGKQEIGNIEEEARKGGVPPGWLR